MFGLAIAALIYIFSDISGASMNPARPLGPALLSGHVTPMDVSDSACLRRLRNLPNPKHLTDEGFRKI